MHRIGNYLIRLSDISVISAHSDPTSHHFTIHMSSGKDLTFHYPTEDAAWAEIKRLNDALKEETPSK